MKKIKEKDLININGGASVTSSIINSFVRLYNSLIDLGRTIGSSIRRIATNSLCPM